MAFLEVLTQLLKSPETLVARVVEDQESLASLIPTILTITVLSAALFGAVVGSYRGGLQLVYGAVKMPALLILPVVITVPALRGLYGMQGTALPGSQGAAVALLAMARVAVLAAAAAPLIWLIYSMSPSYHHAILLLAATLAGAGLLGIGGIFVRTPSLRRAGPALATLVVLGISTAQTGWLLRPFVVRPTADIALFRPMENNVFDALNASASSAQGHFGGWHAEPEGFVGDALEGAP